MLLEVLLFLLMMRNETGGGFIKGVIINLREMFLGGVLLVTWKRCVFASLSLNSYCLWKVKVILFENKLKSLRFFYYLVLIFRAAVL